MPQQQQPQQSGSEASSLDFLWAIILTIGIVLVVWYFGKSYITQADFYTKLAELHLVGWVFSGWSKVATIVGLPTPNMQNINQLIIYMHQHTGPVPFEKLIKVGSAVGDYMRYPFSLILLWMAVVLYFTSVTLKFKKKFSMKKLKAQEKYNWPRIMPVANLNLINTQLDKMPWAMAMSPIQFCKKNDLLKKEIIEGRTSISVLTDRAHDLFALQLGPVWRGPQALPKHVLALLAIFVARVDDDIDAADHLLDQIAASASSNKLDFGGSEKLLSKHINFKPMVKIFNKHAYVSTVMASALDLARGAGVLASADFIWLKPIDRKLWYTLNCVGRQSSYVEVAGIVSHWLSEIKLGIPLSVPMVDQAVSGLEEAIGNILYEPNED